MHVEYTCTLQLLFPTIQFEVVAPDGELLALMDLS